jgi:hypothetical protein
MSQPLCIGQLLIDSSYWNANFNLITGHTDQYGISQRLVRLTERISKTCLWRAMTKSQLSFTYWSIIV